MPEYRIKRFQKDIVDKIAKKALSLGWTKQQLYGRKSKFAFSIGNDYGLACYLDRGDKVVLVTDKFVKLVNKRGIASKFYKWIDNAIIDKTWDYSG